MSNAGSSDAAVTSTASVSRACTASRSGASLRTVAGIGEFRECEERCARDGDGLGTEGGRDAGAVGSGRASPRGSRARRARRARKRAVSTPLRVWKVAGGTGVEPARVPEGVRAGQRRVPAQRDLRLRREPPQPVRPVVALRGGTPSPRASSRPRRSPSTRRAALVEEAHAGRVPPERLGGERVDDEKIHRRMVTGRTPAPRRFSPGM